MSVNSTAVTLLYLDIGWQVNIMFNYLLLFLLPALAYGQIDIKIRADTDPSLASVTFSGEDIAIISDQERETFKLTDANLKDASAIFAGRRCTDIYVKRPTPWADVYRKFGWEEVQRTLRPVSAKILSITSKPVAVASTEYVNRSNYTAKYNSGLTQSVEETVGNSWSNGGVLTVGQEINYSVGIGATGSIGGSTSLSFAANWGKESRKEKKITVGASSNVEVEVPPYQVVTANLIATRGSMEVQVNYEATAEGDVFCNHHGGYKGHMWWAYPLSALQRLGNLPQTIRTVETITIGFYTTFKIEVKNSKTKVEIQNIPAAIL